MGRGQPAGSNPPSQDLVSSPLQEPGTPDNPSFLNARTHRPRAQEQGPQHLHTSNPQATAPLIHSGPTACRAREYPQRALQSSGAGREGAPCTPGCSQPAAGHSGDAEAALGDWPTASVSPRPDGSLGCDRQTSLLPLPSFGVRLTSQSHGSSPCPCTLP